MAEYHFDGNMAKQLAYDVALRKHKLDDYADADAWYRAFKSTYNAILDAYNSYENPQKS